MAKFLNKKEQVLDVRLTPYGKHLLSVGSFRPTYYAFYDSNIIYDKRYTSTLSGSTPGMLSVPMESQNSIKGRIKDDTVYLAPIVSFTSPEYSEEILYEDDQYLTDISPTRMQPAPDVFKYVNSIGDALLSAAENNLAPAWKLVCIEGDFSSVDPFDIVNETKVPQIDVEIIYTKRVSEYYANNDPNKAMDILGRIGPFADNNYIEIEAQNFILYGEEVNTQMLTENFDVEIFEVVDNLGAKATGQFAIDEDSADPSAGDLITISDGYRSVVFEWVASGAASTGDIAVIIETSNDVVNAKRLAYAINNSTLNIDAEYIDSTTAPALITLTNQRIGVRANVPIDYEDASYVDADSTFGMSDGQDGTDVLNRKYFDTEIAQVVDGYMYSARPANMSVGTAPTQNITTGSVSYYFDYYRDTQNDRKKLCKALEYYNKETYYINVEIDCNFNDMENVYYDIYGSAVEPEICLD